MNKQELEKYKIELMKSLTVDLVAGRDRQLFEVLFYDDVDNDEIKYYIFNCEKDVPKNIIENTTCLESIDLIDLASQLKQLE